VNIRCLPGHHCSRRERTAWRTISATLPTNVAAATTDSDSNTNFCESRDIIADRLFDKVAHEVGCGQRLAARFSGGELCDIGMTLRREGNASSKDGEEEQSRRMVSGLHRGTNNAECRRAATAHRQ
jgi:hypothetical protein